MKNTQTTLCEGLNQSAEIIHSNNKEKGFYNEKPHVGVLLMLVVSELGEAMEAHRKGRFTDLCEPDLKEVPPTITDFEVRIKDTFEDEIADAVIRLLDLSAFLGIDLEWHINAKVNYNKARPFLHGKKY